MADEVIPTITVDYSRWYANEHIWPQTFLTGEQQAYFLFALLALFVVGFGLLFYWQDKKNGDV